MVSAGRGVAIELGRGMAVSGDTRRAPGRRGLWLVSPWATLGALATLASVAIAGCSASNGGALSGDNGGAGEGPGSGNGAGGASSGENGGGSASMAAPEGDDGGITTPETKVESNYESPVATGNVVWSANPTNDEVAYIDATSFTVQTVQTGEGPTYLAAVPNADDIAIVQNVVSQDATLLHRSSQGTIATTTFASTPDANSWAISPSGHWA